jgi:hypothetical protein
MDDTPYVNDGADASLRKTVSLLNKIEAKTGSATITGPVTVTNEVEIKNDANNPLPVSDNNGSLTVDGTVELGSTSLAALENISVTFPATQNVNVTNAGLNVSVTNLPATQPVSGTFWPTTQPISGSVSVSNLPATQPVSGTIGTFNSSLVNAGSPFSYYGAGVYGTFDAGVDADYVEFSLDGGGGGFTHNLSLSTSNSPFYASNSTAAGLIVFNDKFPNSSLDTTAYRFSNTALNAGSTGTYVLSLRNGDIKHRYVRVEITGGGGGGWSGRFESYKSLGLVSRVSAQCRIENRVPIAGVVDINSCTRELPVNDSALISSVGTTSEAAAASDLAVSSISGLFRRLLQRITTLLPANLTVSSTRLLVDGSGVTQPVSLASVPSHAVTGSGSFTAAQATAANLNATVVGSGSFTAAQATASSLKAQAQILDSAGSLLTYGSTGVAGSPSSDVITVQGASAGTAVNTKILNSSGTAVTYAETGTYGSPSVDVLSVQNPQGVTATITTFTSTTASTSLVAVGSTRKALTVYNSGPGDLYISPTATCTTTNFQLKLSSGDFWECPASQVLLSHTGVFATSGTAYITNLI